jgi:hypothetical protein
MDADGSGTVSQGELLSSAKVIAEDGARMQSANGSMPQVSRHCRRGGQNKVTIYAICQWKHATSEWALLKGRTEQDNHLCNLLMEACHK